MMEINTMLLSKRWLLPSFLILSTQSNICHAAGEPGCPESVEYEVSVSGVPAGWSGGFRPGVYSSIPPKSVRRSARFSNAALYFEGGIESQFELKSEVDVQLEADKEYSVQCLYSDGIILWKKLPVGLKKCTYVKHNKTQKPYCE